VPPVEELLLDVLLEEEEDEELDEEELEELEELDELLLDEST
jgi:hypothetical protein